MKMLPTFRYNRGFVGDFAESCCKSEAGLLLSCGRVLQSRGSGLSGKPSTEKWGNLSIKKDRVEDMKRLPTIIACCALVLAGCSGSGDQPAPGTTTIRPNTAIATTEMTESASTLEGERLRQQVGQLMMVGVQNFDDALGALEQGAGGIFIGSDTDAAILTEPGRDIAALRERVGRPFAVSIDFEGGRVLRHAEILGDYPSPQVMAETKSPEEVRQLAKEMGDSLASRGITMNFAPVVDLDGAGLEVVGDRAFSHDPLVAADYAAAFAEGMLDAGVTPVYKHFPGHGRASGDSHLGEVVTPPLDELKTLDLIPYTKVLPGTRAAVMLGHLVVPDFGEAPATLNPEIYKLLREGSYPGGAPFEGPVITDDLSGMKAITDNYRVPQAVVSALGAGADMALWISTADLSEAIDATVTGVESGELPANEIEAKAERVSVLQR